MVPPHCYDPSSTSVTASRLFCIFLAHGSFWRHTLTLLQSPCTRSLLEAFALIQHSRTRPLLAAPPPFSQPSRAPLRRLLAHDHLWQLSSFTVFSRTPSQASNTRSLVAAFAFSQSLRTPLHRLLAYDCLWQLSPFHRLLAHPIAGSLHKIACGSPRLFTGFSRTPSQASRTRSLVAAFTFPQSSWAPLHRLFTHDRFWQLLPCRSLLVYPFAGFSHMIAFGSFRLSTVSLRTPSPASYARSLVRAFIFLQSSCTRSLLAAFAFGSLLAHGHF